MNLFPIFQYGLVGLLVVLVTLFSSVMFCETCKEWVGELLGLHTKNVTLKFLGIGMGGVLLALQALMSYKRAKALEDSANAQAEAAKAQAKATEEQAKANQNTEQGQRQERLKNAIEHLGHDNASVRLGGAYELFHLAEDTAEDKKDLRQTVLDILCAHIRRTTREGEYREKYKSKPSEEIQSLLTLLFVQEHEVFKGLNTNLQGSWLNGANLEFAYLEQADLTGAYLQRTNLVGAQLQETALQGADLRGAELQKTDPHLAELEKIDPQFAKLTRMRDLDMANLQRTNLRGVDLRGVDLRRAELQTADLREVKAQGVNLQGARLQGTRLRDAQLQGANLMVAHLQEADLAGAQLQGANLMSAGLQGAKGCHQLRRITEAAR